jgi:sugar/nucleoside kinase (ribokinase family)
MEGISETKYILGIGNPIVDITGETDEESIKKYELGWGKTVFCNDKNVGFFDDLANNPNTSYVAGGSITNAIRITNVHI